MARREPEIDFLRPGTYNINTEVFKVEIYEAIRIGENEIGIVEARDGQPMDLSDVVVETPEGHNNFQDGHAFLMNGGSRGPQEKILTSGTYYINPYLFSVTTREQIKVARGEVAVLISNIGKDPSEYVPEGTSPTDATWEEGGKTRHVVPRGFRGIHVKCLAPGRYINLLAYTTIIIPTTTRSIDWSAERNRRDGATLGFDPFQVVSHDGFPMSNT